MGGAMFLGIRHEDGSKSMAEVWTNHIPWLVTRKEFLNGGEIMREWVAKFDPKGQWPRPRKVSKLTYSEYGVVLVDCMEKIIFSRQDYCTPDKVPFSLCLADGDYEELQEYIKEGWPYQFVEYRWKEGQGIYEVPFTQEMTEKLLECIEAKRPADFLTGRMYKIHMDLSPWKVDHRNSRPSHQRNVAKEIRGFFKNWG